MRDFDNSEEVPQWDDQTTHDLTTRLRWDVFTAVEDWRRAQPKIPSKNAAIEQLLKQALGLTNEEKSPA
jgi:hypothetical protein